MSSTRFYVHVHADMHATFGCVGLQLLMPSSCGVYGAIQAVAIATVAGCWCLVNPMSVWHVFSNQMRSGAVDAPASTATKQLPPPEHNTVLND